MRDFVPDEFIPEPDAVHGIPEAPLDDRIPDELVDAFFDGDLDEQDSREFIRDLRKDATTAKHVVSTNSALEALRRPVPTPNFTSSILNAIDEKTPWLSGREFARVPHWRAVAAVGFLSLITAAFVTQRVAPGASFAAQDAPLTQITQSMPDAASEIGLTLNASFTAAQQFVTEPLPEPEACDGSPKWTFDSLCEALRSSKTQNDAACTVTASRSEQAKPECITECGAMRTRTHPIGFNNSFVGTLGDLHASDTHHSGAIIVTIK